VDQVARVTLWKTWLSVRRKVDRFVNTDGPQPPGSMGRGGLAGGKGNQERSGSQNRTGERTGHQRKLTNRGMCFVGWAKQIIMFPGIGRGDSKNRFGAKTTTSTKQGVKSKNSKKKKQRTDGLGVRGGRKQWYAVGGKTRGDVKTRQSVWKTT